MLSIFCFVIKALLRVKKTTTTITIYGLYLLSLDLSSISNTFRRFSITSDYGVPKNANHAAPQASSSLSIHTAERFSDFCR